MPPAWTRRLEEELLADQVTRCYERSPFWRRKLAGAGVRPEHVLGAEDLRRIPFTTKEELRASQEADPPLGDFACVGSGRGRPRPPDVRHDREAARARVHGRGSEDVGAHRRPRLLGGGRAARRRAPPLPQLQLLHRWARRPRLPGGDRRDDGPRRAGPEQAAARGVGGAAADRALLHLDLPALPGGDREGGRDRAAPARPAEADRRGGARRPARRHAGPPGGALGCHHARHLRALGRLGHVRG